MKKFLFFISFFSAVSAFSQKDKVLFTVNKVPVKVSEFKRVYEKNLDLVQDEESKNIDKYLDLYVNYKLKVAQAYALKLDTFKSYKRELNSYKNQLAAPYLQDNSLLDKLVEEAYFRTKNEIKAKHILVNIPKGTRGKDTLQYFNKINAYRDRVLSGESFEKVAAEVSQDPSAKKNNGNLGYFSAFKMVYPFEDAAYKTKIGEVSKPFKTRFGYHIVKVDTLRASKGEFKVAHIVASDRSIVGKARMDTVYKKLQAGESFKVLAKKYSSDRNSAKKGGELSKFSVGRMVEQFEEAVLSLKKPGDYSKPFKTKFGWHIVKLLKKFPVLSLEESKHFLIQKIKGSNRMSSNKDAIVKKLKKQYKILINQNSIALFKNSDRREFPKDSMQNTLLTINNKEISQEEFSKFIKYRKQYTIDNLLEKFINFEIVNYYKENLVNTEPDYKNTLQEYKDGLLLFDLMQKKLWDKSTKDSIGLKKFFNASKHYKGEKFSDKNKGEVMNAYQEFLEKKWIEDLRKNAVININKRALRRFKKNYKQ